MAEYKREMDIAAQLRMLAEHSRSKGPVLREAAEVIEAMAFRLVALREELDKAKEQNDMLAKRLDEGLEEYADYIMRVMGIMPPAQDNHQDIEQAEREWIQHYRWLEHICKRNREKLELRRLARALDRIEAVCTPKWVARLIKWLNHEE